MPKRQNAHVKLIETPEPPPTSADVAFIESPPRGPSYATIYAVDAAVENVQENERRAAEDKAKLRAMFARPQQRQPIRTPLKGA